MNQRLLPKYSWLIVSMCVLLCFFLPGYTVFAQTQESSEPEVNSLLWVVLLQLAVFVLGLMYIGHCKKAERLLRQSLKHYQNFIKHFPQKVFYKRENLVYEFCNEEYARSLKISSHAIAGKTDHDLYPHEIAQKYREEDMKALNSGSQSFFEETSLSYGRETIVQTIRVPVQDHEGKLIGLLGLSRDVTAHKHAERMVREHEQWFATTLKSIGEAVMTTDNEGRLTFMNSVAEQLTGWTQDEALGKDIGFKMFEQDSFSSGEEDSDDSLHNEIIIGIGEDSFLIARDGKKIFIEYNGAPIKDDRGNITGVVLILKDITERKQAEETLRKAHDDLELRVKERTAELAKANEELRILGKAVETMQLGVTIADASGKIMYTNPADATMHGYAIEELIGQNVQILAPPELRKQMPPKQIERMKGWIRESMNIRNDDCVFPVHLTSSVVRDDENKVLAIVTTCEDITERKQTEKTLAEERNLLRTLIDSIPDYIYIKDHEGRFLLVNTTSTYSQMPTPEAFLGKTDFDILPHEIAERLYTDDQMVLSSGRSIINQEELNIDPENEKERWFSTTKVPLRDSQEEIIGLVGISRNVTEHKQTEAKIEHINAVLRAIQDVNQIIVREKNQQQLLQNVCKGLIETRGFQAASILLMEENGQVTASAESGLDRDLTSLLEKLTPETLPVCIRKAMEQPEALIIRQHAESCKDCPFAHFDEDHQKMLVRLEHDGKCYGIMATIFPKHVFAYDEDKTLLEDVASDIAFALHGIGVEEEQKKTEKTLERERKRLYNLLENLPVYVYLQAPDYSIRFANRYFRERFGEPEQGHCYKLLWGRSDLLEESPTYHVFYSQVPQEWEWNHYPTGKVYQVYDYPFTDFDGSPLVLELGIDITERKQMEIELKEERVLLAKKVEERTAELSLANQQLQQEIEERKQIQVELQQSKEAAESANQAKSGFLANMSHELRTPLNAIMGYAQIMQTSENLSERQIEGLETIKMSGQHLLNLINEILDLSKIETGHMELALNEFHLPEFLRNLAEMIRIRAEQKGLAFEYECDAELPEGVRCDERKLRQVLINLLGNAVKFTEQGSVTLRVTRCGVRGAGKEPATRLKFEISDTGIGIAQHRLEEIFLPFQQVGEKQYSIEGTGLGLAISQNLVRMMGSKLKVESRPGQGSRFWFEIEVTEVEGVTPQSKPHQQKIIGYKGKRRMILVADDRKENRAFLVSALRPLGFEILEAENGHDCLEKTHTAHPDALLLDLRMPLMDGFEVARHIRKKSSLSQIPLIAISASVYEEIRQQSFQAGCNRFLSKPIHLDELLETLHSILPLKWIYEKKEDNAEADANSPQAAETIAVLQQKQIDTIIKYASKGRAKKLLQYLDKLAESTPEHQLVIEEIRGLTKKFQFQRIIERLQHQGEES